MTGDPKWQHSTLRIRPLCLNDAAALANICADPQTEFLLWPHLITSRDAATQALEDYFYGEGKFGRIKIWWGVFIGDDLIGTVALRLRDGGEAAGLPIYMAPPWRGLGIARIVLARAKQHAEQMGFRVYFRVAADNHAMQRVAEKMGVEVRPS